MHREIIHCRNRILSTLTREQHHLAHIERLRVEHAHERDAVGPLLAAVSEHDHSGLVLVGQELEALGGFERADVFILLVEEDGVRFCEGVEGLEDGVHGGWAF